MRILLLTSYFPRSTDPVRGMFNYQQAHALARHCEVKVVAPVQWFPVRLWHGAGPDSAPYRETVGELTTWHPRYFLPPRIGRDFYSLQMAAWVLPRLARIRREYPFDVLLATWAFPDVIVGALAARLWNVPLLAKVHGSDINVQTDFPLRRKQIRWALDQAHRVLAVSGALRERLIGLGVPAERIMVHHNGVDRERFRPGDRAEARRHLKIPVEGKALVYVGYMNPPKAVNVLIDALGELRASGRLDFTAHLVGCGPLKEDLEAQARSLGLAESVVFHGRRPHDEIPHWMRAADVFCLPSIREGCPNVVLEALASGCPLVSTRVGSVPDMVDPTAAVLVPPGESSPLAEGIRTALDRQWDPEALRRSVSHYDWDTSARALYEAACEAVELRRAPQPERALAANSEG
ncbi:MAG: glycosyltransferase family 4 protein [Armatimonadota bacterium]